MSARCRYHAVGMDPWAHSQPAPYGASSPPRTSSPRYPTLHVAWRMAAHATASLYPQSSSTAVSLSPPTTGAGALAPPAASAGPKHPPLTLYKGSTIVVDTAAAETRQPMPEEEAKELREEVSH